MATKKEWEEYFQLINDRKPNDDEVKAALQNGDFTEEAAEAAKPAAEEKAAAPKEDKAAEAKQQASETFEKAKKHASNYFAWLKERFLHPIKHVGEENPNKIYLWITFALTTLFSAGIFVNVVRRIFAGFAAYMKDEYSAKWADKVMEAANKVLPSLTFDLVVAFAILFLASLPGLALITKNKVNFKQLVNEFLGWFPAIIVFPFAGFVYSFIASVPKVESFSEVQDAVMNLAQTGIILVVLAFFGVTMTTVASYYFTQKYMADDKKADLFWWQVAQIVMTAVVLFIGIRFIMMPMFSSLGDTIQSAIKSVW